MEGRFNLIYFSYSFSFFLFLHFFYILFSLHFPSNLLEIKHMLCISNFFFFGKGINVLKTLVDDAAFGLIVKKDRFKIYIFDNKKLPRISKISVSQHIDEYDLIPKLLMGEIQGKANHRQHNYPSQ